MTETIREYTEDGVKYRELIVTHADLDDYCNPDTLNDWDERVVSIDYQDNDTYSIVVTVED